MLMIDPRRGAAAAVHAGWRGTCAGIATATIAGLTREFGSAPSDLQVALGPSIGRCCYEVGDELLTAFRVNGAAAADVARWFSRTPEGSLRLDLWSANLDQLVAAGVRREQVHVSGLCTQTHHEVFDSYRVQGPRAGRMIAAIRVPHV
jgi:polyphenol oxidase